ncbi:acyl-CoA dehydrogenase family protein [Brevibacillus dissolubilis]|uniref:acyl-CoA dehydrogenase family protein n=1 Tax=Brevibacillus dissolubilis TaxID=1844116 RepID=UPI001115C41C|nr:acyl-CoA dehydrogenase family protein [Brevibacillus dissolubilis]
METIVRQRTIFEIVDQIGQEVLAKAAPDVDAQSRFPQEAMDAMRQNGLLSVAIPQVYGGLGLDVKSLMQIAETLGKYCSASAMIWAMHQAQVACLVQHADSSQFFRHYLREIAEKQLLIASITSEAGVGGDIGTSIAAVETEGAMSRLTKEATVISYGEYADSYLVTARRTPESAGNDQVLVLLKREEVELTKTGGWDTLGMRGTCSPPFHVTATFPTEQIVPVPFSQISAETMAPLSHILWAGCWLGIATDALNRARKYVQAKARKNLGGDQQGSTRLAEAINLLNLMRNNIIASVSEYEELMAEGESGRAKCNSMAYTIKINTLKITSSQLVAQIVQEALLICGMAGYANESPYSVGRHLRDALSAALMINNDRLTATNAKLSLIQKNL